jgi:hypothetical protein
MIGVSIFCVGVSGTSVGVSGIISAGFCVSFVVQNTPQRKSVMVIKI